MDFTRFSDIMNSVDTPIYYNIVGIKHTLENRTFCEKILLTWGYEEVPI